MMLSQHRTKRLRIIFQWLLVMIIIACAIQPVSAAGGKTIPRSIDGWAAGGTFINDVPPRFVHTAVWTGAEMIVWGGLIDDTPPLNSGGRYKIAYPVYLPIVLRN